MSNVAWTGSAQTLGGAIFQQDGSAVDIVDSSFVRNEALDGPFAGGGAIYVAVGATSDVSKSMFESNVAKATGGEAYGGALIVDGNLIVNEGNSFLNNSVSSKMKAAGGAVAVMQPGQCRFAAHSLATFAENLVRIPDGGFSLRLRISACLLVAQAEGSNPSGGALYSEASGSRVLVHGANFDSNRVLVSLPILDVPPSRLCSVTHCRRCRFRVGAAMVGQSTHPVAPWSSRIV